MISISQAVKNYLARKRAEECAAYVERYAFNVLQFEYICEPIKHHKFKHQIEISIGTSSLFRKDVDHDLAWAVSEARRILTQEDHKEDRDFFIGSYVNEEIIDFGVLLVQVKDPKWAMILKLAF